MAGTPDFTLILQTLCSHDVEFIVVGDVEYDQLLSDTAEFELDGPVAVRVLNLDRLIRLKEDLGREKDRAVLPILRRTLEESQE